MQVQHLRPNHRISKESGVKFQSARMGEFDVDEEKVILFPEGLLGYPQDQKFYLLDLQEYPPAKLLQSLDHPELGFCVVDPRHFFLDYQFHVSTKDIETIGSDDLQILDMLAILSFYANPFRVTINLQGPILFNPTMKLAKQVVIKNGLYHTQHILVKEPF